MNITMIDTGLNNFNALGKFLNGVPDIKFSGISKRPKKEWVKEVLSRFNFRLQTHGRLVYLSKFYPECLIFVNNKVGKRF